MPDDLTYAARHPAPHQLAASLCDACPRRASGVCQLIQAEGLGHLVTQRTYQRRTMLRQEGEPLRYAFIFRAGVVSVARRISGGRRQIIDFLRTGDALGLAGEATMRLSVRAIEHTEVCRIPIDALIDLKRSRSFLRGLIRLVEAATERVREHVVLLGKLTAEQRVTAFLLRYRAASQRIQATRARLDLPMTRRDDYLGIAPETVCRALSWLQERQLIVQIPDGIRILDLKGLERLSASACASTGILHASDLQPA